MKRSVKKEYGEDRKWDYEDFRTQRARHIMKKEGHKRLRRLERAV